MSLKAFYFIAIHNEPYNAPGGELQIEKEYQILKQMIEKADQYNIKLTLMFTPQWADYISGSSERLNDLERWRGCGHEIAGHHHSIHHGDWDGYTDYTLAEIIDRVGDASRYLGTLEDFIEKLRKINPEIKSGCMNDERDKRALPDQIIYDTCSGLANFGEPGRRLSDAVDPEKGCNYYVSVGSYKNMERKWLTHYLMNNEQRQLSARSVFGSMDSGVYGVVMHSTEKEAPAYYSFIEFLHQRDEAGSRSKTVSHIIDRQMLPEVYIPQHLIE